MKLGQIFTQLISTIANAGEPIDDATIQSTAQDARDWKDLQDSGYVRVVDEYRPRPTIFRRKQ